MPSTIDTWLKRYQKGGPEGLKRHGSHASTRKLCEAMESRIAQFRRDYPEAGGRRIRDELRRDEGFDPVVNRNRHGLCERNYTGQSHFFWQIFLNHREDHCRQMM